MRKLRAMHNEVRLIRGSYASVWDAKLVLSPAKGHPPELFVMPWSDNIGGPRPPTAEELCEMHKLWRETYADTVEKND